MQQFVRLFIRLTRRNLAIEVISYRGVLYETESTIEYFLSRFKKLFLCYWYDVNKSALKSDKVG